MIKVVLIDDNNIDNIAHERCIESLHGVEVSAVFTEALSAIEWFEASQRQIDIVLLDINMPGINGFDFLERHAQLGSSKQAKQIIVMLGASLNEVGYQTLRTFDTPWQDKPMTPEALTLWIERLC